MELKISFNSFVKVKLTPDGEKVFEEANKDINGYILGNVYPVDGRGLPAEWYDEFAARIKAVTVDLDFEQQGN